MVVVQRFGGKPVLWGVATWSLLVALCLFVGWTSTLSGVSHFRAYWLAGILTAVLGLWLGWRHRVGTAFFAPLLAWFVVVPFAYAAEFVNVGFFHGLIRGTGLAIFGGFVAAFVEGVVLVAFAFLGRVASAALGHHDDSTTFILPPRTP